ncbi:FliM/FliN family flagellar motor switch protein [Pseudogemmobacter sonorensis]|uniref:FliM/FliN family flagellar motor C-terminal domain-containing protein n=1 Tax=Pseudogemmobacter sonorensis TaxID=2989681 RepID=UPI0036B27B53
MNDILRRKARRGAAPGNEPPTGAEAGWRLAFPRAARDATGLLIEVAETALSRRSLDEVLELLPERALIGLLDGPGGGLGMVALSPGLSSALIEMQTVGRVLPGPVLPRRPSRIDAGLVSMVIDGGLAGLDDLLATDPDLVWAGGFRYASFVEDARSLGLLLDEQLYRLLRARLALGISEADDGAGADGAPGDAAARKARLVSGVRTGELLLVLPAEGRGQAPPPAPEAASSQAGEARARFGDALASAVMLSDCRLDAVLSRLVMPLHEVMDLAPDQVLVLDGAAIDRITLAGLDGTAHARARLGQHRGMRALRLAEIGPEVQAAPTASGTKAPLDGSRAKAPLIGPGAHSPSSALARNPPGGAVAADLPPTGPPPTGASPTGAPPTGIAPLDMSPIGMPLAGIPPVGTGPVGTVPAGKGSAGKPQAGANLADAAPTAAGVPADPVAATSTTAGPVTPDPPMAESETTAPTGSPSAPGGADGLLATG